MIDLNIIQIKIVPTGYLKLRSILIWCLSLGLKFQAAHSYVFQILGFKHLSAQESVSFTNKYQTATQQYCMLSFFFSPHNQLSGCLAILRLYKYVLRTIQSIKRSISILSLSLFIARCSFALSLWQGLLYQFELSTVSANFSCGHEFLLQIAPDDVLANGKKDINSLIIQIHFNSRQLDKPVLFLVVNPLMSRDPNEGDIVKFNPTFQALARSVNSRTKMFIYSLSIHVLNVHVGVN